MDKRRAVWFLFSHARWFVTQMWTQLWGGSSPCSLTKILMVIFILIYNSVVSQLCNISSSHHWIRLKNTSLLFDMIWPYNANMAQVSILVTRKKLWRRKKRCDLKHCKVGRWTLKFLNWLIKTYITEVQQNYLYYSKMHNRQYRCLQIYFENRYFPILFYYNLLCFAILIQNSLIQNGIIPAMNDMLSFNWSQLIFKTEMTQENVHVN